MIDLDKFYRLSFSSNAIIMDKWITWCKLHCEKAVFWSFWYDEAKYANWYDHDGRPNISCLEFESEEERLNFIMIFGEELEKQKNNYEEFRYVQRYIATPGRERYRMGTESELRRVKTGTTVHIDEIYVDDD